MTLKDSFNDANYSFHKLSGAALRVYAQGGSVEYIYDFGLRLLTARYGQGLSTQPFSDIDRETLIEMRDKLVALGGTPPGLPAERPAGPPSSGKLNL